MTPQPKNTITPERAINLFNEGLPLVDLHTSGKIIIETSDNWDKEVVFENCIIEYFSGSVTQFNKPVRLINCHFKNCKFIFTYFLGGLTIDNCTFDSYLDFQAGGHNKTGNAVVISNNDFKDFVNFADCWYNSEVMITNNKFQKGTNVLGKPYNIPVTFDVEAIIKDNIGELGLNNEAEKGW